MIQPKKFTSPFQKPEEEKKKITFNDIRDMSSQEIKNFIGNFPQEYARHCVGSYVRNEILGWEYEGVISWLLQAGALSYRNKAYYIKLPKFEEFDVKLYGMQTLRRRECEAVKLNRLAFEAIN